MRQRVLRLAFAIALVAVMPSFATTIYVVADNNGLYTIDPTTGVTTLIGNMGVEMTDVAILNGAMFGVSFPASGNSSLYSINPNTGAATKIGTDTGAFLNALQFGSNGTLYGAGGSPGCGPPPQAACGSFFTINTVTGSATLVGTSIYESSGDLEFAGSPLYLTSRTSTTDQLFAVNPASGAGTLIGDTLFTEIFGLAYVSETDTLFGFNDVGNHVIALNRTTGAGTSVATYSNSFEILGAATAVPEPRGAYIVLALAALAALLLPSLRKRLLTRPHLTVDNKSA